MGMMGQSLLLNIKICIFARNRKFLEQIIELEVGLENWTMLVKYPIWISQVLSVIYLIWIKNICENWADQIEKI